jgi:peptidoglycan/LPS O-acetylase OafA/YrhL
MADTAQRISYLDGWRGLAIALVLAGHFLAAAAPDWTAIMGVELFFVLSGRLMADILFAENYPLPAFFKRRFSRIYPGLFVFVVATWLACSNSFLAFKLQAVATALSFTLNYAMALTHGVAAIENLWSLCIEEHAYLLLGLIAFIARRRRLDPKFAVLLIGLLSAIDGAVCFGLLHQDEREVYWRTDAHLASIFFGAAAYLYLRGRVLPAWIAIAAFVGGFIAMLGPVPLHYSVAPALFALSVCSLETSPMQVLLAWGPLRSIGIWSYSLYLYQQPFYRLALVGKLSLPIAFVLAAVCGIASFYLIEQPARRFINKRWSGKAPPKIVPVDEAA